VASEPKCLETTEIKVGDIIFAYKNREPFLCKIVEQIAKNSYDCIVMENIEEIPFHAVAIHVKKNEIIRKRIGDAWVMVKNHE
jgi:hypothetical protein